MENAHKTSAPLCPACVSPHVKKTGFSRFGKQCFLCRDCRRLFCLNPIDRSTDPQRKAQILAACQESESDFSGLQLALTAAPEPSQRAALL